MEVDGFGLILTGCAGFIGINFLQDQMPKNMKNFSYVISIDKMGYATKYNEALYRKICGDLGIIMFDADISQLDGTTINGLCSSSKLLWYVVDFASESHVDNSIANPDVIFKENSSIPATLIKWLGGPENIYSYVHISTDEVYGDIPFELKGKEFFKTTSQLKPSNPYAASKAAQDMYLQSINKTYGMNLTIIRMANQFGPYQHPEKMIPASILRALRGETIKIYGEGQNCRQWTYVEQTVSLISRIAFETTYSPSNFHIVHLADTQNLMTNTELVGHIIEELKDYGVDPIVEYVADRKGHDAVYALEVGPWEKQYIRNFESCMGFTVAHYFEGFRNGKYA